MRVRRTRVAILAVAAVMLVQPLAQAAPAPAKAAAVGATDPSVAGSSIQGLGGVLPNFVASGDGVIRLQVGAFDPLADPLPQANDIPLIDENLLAAAPASAAAQYWIVQVRDHRYAEVGAAVENAGASIANVVPDDAYLVRATAAQRAALAQSPAVRWSGYYQPAWRLPTAANGKPALTDLAGTQRYSVYAVRTDPDPSSIGATLAEIPGVTIVDDAGPVVDIEATAAELPFIASVAGVEWVSATPTYVAFNGNARWVLDTGERDVLAATRSNRLTGAGQTAAVADTAPNYRPDKRPTAHTAFRDCVGTNLNTCKEADFTQQTPGSTTAAMLAVAAHNTGHRKMAAFFDLGGAGPNPSDEAAHGTHVAGSVAGDAGPQGTAQDDDGMAPGARLVHQGIADTTGALTGIPTDYYQLFRQAYRPSNPGSVPTTSGTNGNVADYANYQSNQDARTHNNSYGAGVPVADAGGRTAALDQFVWDHEDMAIVVSASNSGPGAGTVTSPSTAKNNFSSGASSNGRQPMVSIGNMANFSSHGPTGDGRFGVTVATPGEIVVGPKGGTNDGYQYLQGTSMSGPILTGALTLVRQYFYDGYGPAGGKGFAVGSANANARRWNPSAALVKAAVVNGAVRMRGWYTGDDGTQRALDGQWPSAGQGFGLVNLDNSLYFANDPTNDWYTDVWRSDAAAFAVTDTGAARTYQIQVAAGQPLDVTLAYTDPASALAAGTETLVNNLDLQVIGPGGTYVGNNIDSRTNPSVAVATTPPGSANPDTVNNLERVHVAAPPAGLYTVRVIGTKVMQGRQGFGLAASGNISAPGTAFAAGPPRQADVAGNPTLASGRVTPGSNDVEKLTFSTNEPTTAKATLTVNGSPVTYSDVYNLGGNVNSPSTFPGMDTAPVETGPDYANKLMVGTTHEIFLTGLSRSTPYTASIEVTDLGGHKVTKTLQFTTLTNVFQPQARDQGQLAQSGDQWKIGKQFYAGIPDTTGDHWLGAFMYRLPESVDPSKITGAIVEVTTAHSLSNLYNVDPLFTMDLLNESVEPAWGTQSFATIHDAPATARALPDTTVRSGGGTTLDFTFACSDLAALKQTLSTVNDGERKAAFRWDSTEPGEASLVSLEFGFNRRSKGPDLRPRLILLTADAPTPPNYTPCDPGTAAPLIDDVRIDNSYIDGGENVFTKNEITVSWHTDVMSDSLVLYREKGTTNWLQVGTYGRTKQHQVRIRNIDTTKHYEFGVRSTSCNGKATTNDNGGKGYDLFRPPPGDLGPPTDSPTFTFESGTENWTATREGTNPTPPDTNWARSSPGDNSSFAWFAEPYGDLQQAHLTSPPITIPGTVAKYVFRERHDLEKPIPDATTTADALRAEYSVDDGATWTVLALYQEQNASYPNYDTRETPAFSVPNHTFRIRFTVNSDDNISTPPYQGVRVDNVTPRSFTPPGNPFDPFITGIGPVTPKSAGASGLDLKSVVAHRPTAAELTAGTGMCTGRKPSSAQ